MRLLRLAVLAAFLVSPARAAFEPAFYNPRAMAMGGAFTSLHDDPVTQLYNPATLGPQDDWAATLSFLRQFHLPAGEVDQELFGGFASMPVRQEILTGTVGLATVYNRQLGTAAERTVNVGYGTRGLRYRGDRRLDAGGSLKFLNKSFDNGGGSATKPSLDAGLLYRWSERYAFGAALINVNGPAIRGAGYNDRAPSEIRFGLSESARGYAASLDLAKREPSGHHPGTAELAAGFERWWATSRAGSFAARTGLSLGDRAKLWSWGAAWRVLGAQLDYAMTIPMQGRTRINHGLALVFRFGQGNPEQEYEKVLAAEIRYRKDLVEALEAAEVKQWKLAEELAQLRQEMDALRGRLASKSASESETKKRLQEVEERHRRAVETFERLKAAGSQIRAKTKQQLFEEDWAAYQRVKLSGAPDAVLIDNVQRLLRQYKDAGVDLSGANQELVRLLKSR